MAHRHATPNDHKRANQLKEMSMRRMWNGFRTAVLAGAVCAALAGWTGVANGAACGDLNNNGSVNSGDVTRLRRVIAGLINPAGECGGPPGPGAIQCGDIRKDGGLAPSDVV